MTGLDPARHVIVEIATLITDDDLEVVAEGPDLVVNQPEDQLAEMDDIVRKMHTGSGLLPALDQWSASTLPTASFGQGVGVTALQVDDRIACCHENVAGADDIRAAKEHDAVPIGMRGVRVKQLNGFAVKENFFFIAKVRVGRPRTRGAWSRRTGRRAHPFHHIFMREERRAFRCIGDVACDITAGNGGTGSSQLFVSSGVVRMKMRVDDESNRPVRDRFRKLLHRGKYLIRHLGSARIHKQDPVLANLHGDVAGRPDEHVDVSLHMQHVNFGILLGADETSGEA